MADLPARLAELQFLWEVRLAKLKLSYPVSVGDGGPAVPLGDPVRWLVQEEASDDLRPEEIRRRILDPPEWRVFVSGRATLPVYPTADAALAALQAEVDSALVK